MKDTPLRTSVVGSYPFPGWLEFASMNLSQFGPDDVAEARDDAVLAAVGDQLVAGLDAITDGEVSRLDFNLSFYGYLEGIDLESSPPRRFGPPAHDQRGKHAVTGELAAPRGLGVVEEYQRLTRIVGELPLDADRRPTLKASIPGPYTLSGRLLPNDQYPDRWAMTEALLPLVRAELERLQEAGCEEVCVDEPSMSCYGWREDTERFADIFNRTIEPVAGKMRVCAHLCFGNFKGRAVGKREPEALFPAFLKLKVDEMHMEMTTLNFTALPLIRQVVDAGIDAAVGVIDVKSYYIETPEDVAGRVRQCLEYAPPEKLVFAPDCGLSQTARWAAKKKLHSLVAGARAVRDELGLA